MGVSSQSAGFCNCRVEQRVDVFYDVVEATMSAQAGAGLLVSFNMAECAVDWVPMGLCN